MMTKFMIVDGTNISFRAACVAASIQPQSYSSEGIPTGTLSVFFNIFNKVMMEIQPDYIVCCWDTNTNTFRKKLYPDYKATRHKNDLDVDIKVANKQFKFIRLLLEKLGIKNINIEEYESDDICGSCVQISQADENYIISGDKDFFQLVNENTFVIFPKSGFTEYIKVTPQYIEDKYNINYINYIDMKILCTDKSDNIIGYKGCGPKIASKMINEFGNSKNIVKLTIDDLYNYNKTIKNNLEDWKNRYELLTKLMTIKKDLEIPYKFEDFEINLLKWLEIKPILEDLQMYRLINLISWGAVYRLKW